MREDGLIRWPLTWTITTTTHKNHRQTLCQFTTWNQSTVIRNKEWLQRVRHKRTPQQLSNQWVTKTISNHNSRNHCKSLICVSWKNKFSPQKWTKSNRKVYKTRIAQNRNLIKAYHRTVQWHRFKPLRPTPKVKFQSSTLINIISI